MVNRNPIKVTITNCSLRAAISFSKEIKVTCLKHKKHNNRIVKK